LVDESRVPAPVSSLSVLPSPFLRRVGVHIFTFEACSSFTRVTACWVAHPPFVGFIARLRPGRFPGSDARKLPSSTNNLLGWVLPPLVICPVGAHSEIRVKVLIGVALPKWSLARLHKRVTESIKRSGGVDDKRALHRLLSLLKYVSGDYDDPKTFTAIKSALGSARRTTSLSRPRSSRW